MFLKTVAIPFGTIHFTAIFVGAIKNAYMHVTMYARYGIIRREGTSSRTKEHKKAMLSSHGILCTFVSSHFFVR